MTASARAPRAIRLVTSVCGLGWLPGAPGTWCSVAAIGLGYLLHRMGGLPALLLATVIASALGFGIIRHALLEGEDPDPGEIVIDELVGQWIALLPLSAGLWRAGVPWHVFPWPGRVGVFRLFWSFDTRNSGPARCAAAPAIPPRRLLFSSFRGASAPPGACPPCFFYMAACRPPPPIPRRSARLLQ